MNRSDTQQSQIVQLGIEKREFAGDTAARAFLNDPLFSWIFGGPRHLDGLRHFFQGYFQMIWKNGQCVACNEASNGVMLSVESSSYPVGMMGKVRFLLSLLKVIPTIPDLSQKWRGVMKAFAELDRLHPLDDHIYLAVLAVSPDMQGRGIGKALLNSLIDRSMGQGRDIYLETSNSVNLPIYRHFGFEVEHEVKLPGSMPPFWTMRRTIEN